MTIDQQLQLIRQKCIEANPEITELKFGCVVRLFSGRLRVLSSTYTLLKDDLYEYQNDAGTNCAVQLAEVIGRPIRLTDVLLAIYAYDNLRTDGMTYFLRLHAELNGDLMLQDGPFGEWSRRATWNLRQDDLTAQSDACIQFLWELLS